MVYLPLHMQKPFFLLNFLFTLYFTLPAQTNYPKNDFRSPVDTTMSLAGNFGEIRPNHFHSGIDFSTAGKNQAVLAIEKGWNDVFKPNSSRSNIFIKGFQILVHPQPGELREGARE